MTERLQKVLDAGGTLALFPLLEDWPESELRALMDDVNELHDAQQKSLDDGWGKEAMKAENFFRPSRAKALDAARDEMRMSIVGMAAEICSVAEYYLTRMGEK